MAVARRLIGALLLTTSGGCGASAEHGPPDVLLVALDTVRWDHTDLAGYPAGVTPNLAAFAQLPGSVVFSRAYTDAAWSQPAYVSLFTGQQALTHGVGYHRSALDPGQATLATMLRASGYQTRAYASGPHLAPATGLADGFDQYNHSIDQRTIAIQVEPALDWLKEDSAVPRFAFVHGYDAHAPYGAPAILSDRFQPDGKPLRESCTVPGWRCFPPGEMNRTGPALSAERQAQLVGAYDAAVLYADHQLGRLLHGLEASGRLENTVVVVLSDHGEMLGEDGGLGHDAGYSDAVYHVPLVVRFPSDAPARTVDRLVSLSDLVPTLAQRFEMVAPGGADGHVIGELLDPAVESPPHPHRGASTCCYYVRDGDDAAWALHGTGTLDWSLLPGSTGRADATTHLATVLGDWPVQLTGVEAVNREAGERDPALKKALQESGYWKSED